jgi:hypothetical protein
MSDLIPNAGSVQHIDELFVLEDTDLAPRHLTWVEGRILGTASGERMVVG